MATRFVLGDILMALPLSPWKLPFHRTNHVERCDQRLGASVKNGDGRRFTFSLKKRYLMTMCFVNGGILRAVAILGSTMNLGLKEMNVVLEDRPYNRRCFTRTEVVAGHQKRAPL